MKISIFLYKAFASVFILLALHVNLDAQKGYPYLSPFSFNESIENDNFDLIQDNNLNILIANRKGILTFDSRKWELLPLPYYPVTLAKSSFDGTIYVGCRNGFGILEQDITGQYTYLLLSDTVFTGEIFSIGLLPEKEFFLSRNRLYYSAQDDDPFKYWEFPYENNITGSFVYGDDFYFMVFNKGLFKVEGDSFKLVLNDRFSTRTELKFSLTIDSKNMLIGNSDNELFLFNGTSFTPVMINDSEYLTASIITDGAYLGGNKIAVGTLMGGIIIADYKTGETSSILNYKTGLPDDEVYCLGTDINKGLWLCHSFGVSRIDNNLKVANLTWYPGLSGNLTNAAWYREQLYIGTSDGIYELKEKREYREKTVDVKPVVLSQRTTISPEITQPESIPIKTEPVVIENLSKKEQRKKRRADKEVLTPETNAPIIQQATILDKIISSVDNATRIFVRKPEDESFSANKKKVYALQSISHSYEKISGISGKCTEITAFFDHLLVSTNNGLYDIYNRQVVAVLPNTYVNFINPGPGDLLFAGAGKSVFILKLIGSRWEVLREFDTLEYPVYSACMTSPTELWLGSDNSAHKIILDSGYYSESDETLPITTKFSDKVILKTIDKQLYFFLASGIYRMENNEIKQVKSFDNLKTLPEYYFSDNNVVWYRSDGKWSQLSDNSTDVSLSEVYLGIFESVQDIFVSKEGNLWVIANNKEIFKIQKETEKMPTNEFSVFFSALKGTDDKPFSLDSPKISYKNSSLRIEFSAPYYLAPEKTEFTYKIDGLNKTWSPWSTISTIEYPILPPGKYTIHAKAKNIFGQESVVNQLNIVIKPPFWRTTVFYLFVIILVFALFSFFVKFREQKLQKDKLVLEQKVKERTIEIEYQKNEISEQKKEITDSILYAKRIQSAVLPSTKLLSSVLSEHFVLFLPKDIVSGDFYWSTVKGDKIVILAADCTGHGVPGAFMSMLGISFLNEIVSTHKLDNAGTLLDELRDHVKATLAKSGDEVQARDGMDIALCIIDQKQMKLQFAGAYNPMYQVREKELIEFKGDKMPIGWYDLDTGFTNNVINIKKGDCFYIFSDGFIDQFGGKFEKKFLSKQFKDLILHNNSQTMNNQKEVLVKAFENWKGKLQQIDDVLVIGFRI